MWFLAPPHAARQSRRHLFVLLCALAGAPAPALATGVGHDGAAILRMCQGADKVKSLSVMCHSYLNGYLDTTHWHAAQAKGKAPAFCLDAGAKEAMPAKVVLWLRAHPMDLTHPAPEILGRALKDLFPCR
jgi:hypothetical protein